MKVTDELIKSALRRKERPSEKLILSLSEKINAEEEDHRVRQVTAGIRRSASDHRGRGLLAGFLAIAGVIVLAVLLVKLIPAVRRPESPDTNAASRKEMEVQKPAEGNEGAAGSEPALEPAGAAESEPALEPAGAANGNQDTLQRDSFLRIPVYTDDLRWGMTEEEVTEVLGEADFRDQLGSRILLTYEQPVETAFGACTMLQLSIDNGTRISDTEIIRMGLNYMMISYPDNFLASSGNPTEEFYGPADRSEKAGHPLNPGDRIEGWHMALDRRHAWELQNHPEYREELENRMESLMKYQKKHGGIAADLESGCADDDMLVDVCVSFYQSLSEESGEDRFPALILDAGRYLLASAPAETLSEEDAGTEGIEGSCIYDTDEFTFMMPELWRNAGVTAEEEDNILRIMYRGLTLCAFTVSENSKIVSGDPPNYLAQSWDLGNGYSVVLWVNNWAILMRSGAITSEQEVFGHGYEAPVVYTAEEDLEDFLYVLTGKEYDAAEVLNETDNSAHVDAVGASINYIYKVVVPSVKLKDQNAVSYEWNGAGELFLLASARKDHVWKLSQIVSLIKGRDETWEQGMTADEQIQNSLDWLKQHWTALQLQQNEERVLLDWFVTLYGPGNQNDMENQIQLAAGALPYTSALTKKEKDAVTALAEKEYRRVLGDADVEVPVFSWCSRRASDYQYFGVRIGPKTPEPGQCIVICVKAEADIGEGAYLMFSYMKTKDGNGWELVNYGY